MFVRFTVVVLRDGGRSLVGYGLSVNEAEEGEPEQPSWSP